MGSLSGMLESPRQWAVVLLRPRVATFGALRSTASWRAVWWSVVAQALIEGAAVAWAVGGPGAGGGVSSLPIGPKLVLPREPLWLGLAGFAGTLVEFFLFAGLLYASARFFGGHGAFQTQAYLMALFWVPLMALSALAQSFGATGSVVGLVARVYALVLLAPMLAAAHEMTLGRAWLVLIITLTALGLVALVVLVVASLILSVRPPLVASAVVVSWRRRWIHMCA